MNNLNFKKILFAIWIVSVFVIMFSCTTIQKTSPEVTSQVVTIKPSGEYAEIDVASSNEVATILWLDESATKEKRQSTAHLVEENLGSYNPVAIFGLAAYYLKEGSIEQFALYYGFASLRGIIDVQCAKDSSLNDVLPILSGKLGELVEEQYVNKGGDLNCLKTALQKAVPQVIKLDKETPRNYDARWPSLHSINAYLNLPITHLTEHEKEIIIEAERKYFIEAAQ